MRVRWESEGACPRVGGVLDGHLGATAPALSLLPAQHGGYRPPPRGMSDQCSYSSGLQNNTLKLNLFGH